MAPFTIQDSWNLTGLQIAAINRMRVKLMKPYNDWLNKENKDK